MLLLEMLHASDAMLELTATFWHDISLPTFQDCLSVTFKVSNCFLHFSSLLLSYLHVLGGNIVKSIDLVEH